MSKVLSFPFKKLLLEVSAETGFTPEQICGHSRRRKICQARFTVMTRAHKALGLSAAHIGRMLGDRDHTTILHGLKRAEEEGLS